MLLSISTRYFKYIISHLCHNHARLLNKNSLEKHTKLITSNLVCLSILLCQIPKIAVWSKQLPYNQYRTQLETAPCSFTTGRYFLIYLP